MRHLKEAIAVGAASAILLTGCGSQEAVYPPASAEWQKPFEQIDQYWEHDRSLGELGIKLTSIEAGETFTCGQTSEPYKGGSVAKYCPSSKTIAVFTGTYQALESELHATPDQSQLLKKLILGHEYGHGLQDKYDHYADTYVAPELFEKDADCLAGAALNELGAPYTDTVKNAEIAQIYKVVARGVGAKDHGSGEERFDAFLTGQRPFMGQQSSCGVIPEAQA